MKKSLLFLCLLLLVGSLSAQTNAEIIELANSYHDSAKEPQGLDMLKKVLIQEPNNPDALWNASFLTSKVGFRLTDEDEQKAYYRRAEEMALKAVKLAPNNPQCHYALAVAKGRIALIASAKERVAAGKDIRKAAEDCLRLDPNHAGGHHVMGLWHFRMANLSWAERTAANLLFGGLPKDATNEESETHFKKAISLRPNYVLFYYDLARLYEEIDRDMDAVNSLKKAVSLPGYTLDDPRYKREAKELLDDLQ